MIYTMEIELTGHVTISVDAESVEEALARSDIFTIVNQYRHKYNSDMDTAYQLIDHIQPVTIRDEKVDLKWRVEQQ